MLQQHQVQTLVENLFREALGLDQLSMITSYSWRRMGSSLANLCQSFVDAFIAACTACGAVQNITGNNGTCPP